jgi:hypothetical protein
MSQRLKRFLFHQSTCSKRSLFRIVLPAKASRRSISVKAPKDEVIDTIQAIVLTVESALIAVVRNVIAPHLLTLPAVVICNNLESAIEPVSIVAARK